MATRPYSRSAYVYGGATPAVARAIQQAGYARPGANPVRVPTAMVNAQPPAAGGNGGGDGGAPAAAAAATPAPFDFSTDPGYLAALAAEQAGSVQLDASLRAAREQALVRFGDPSLAGAFGLDGVDPLTAAMAQQATTSGISTLAGLQRQRDLAQQGTVNTLAAHGLINSGDLGWRSGQNAQNYASALYNAQQGVLDTLAQSARDTALQKQQLQTNTVDALTKAYGTYVANPQYYGMAQQPIATPAPAPVTPTPAPVAPIPAPRTPTRTTPVSRLATPSPYRFQAARNVSFG
jgi:hypothetical protein